ncbi:Exosome complex component RRP43 [Trichinella zimbabwensis]|uniref:Ribosomal RNA-processing protein 43 n=1 Tax=Trichinella zimbabwensis TaxID=268475 RepID=A0A0V1I3G0_9BILA|nr:Exosome complex component RRP43 [Trichinella zimbabwensis]
MSEMLSDRQKKVIEPSEHIREYITKNKIRYDGRKANQFRNAAVHRNMITTADSSAIARIGGTAAICGMNLEIMENDTLIPSPGLVVNIESVSPTIVVSWQNEIDKAKCILKSLIEKNIIDSKSLEIFNGELFWVIYCDFVVLDCAGGILEVCLVALLAALQELKFPVVRVLHEDFKINLKNIKVDTAETSPVSLSNVYPVASTFLKFGDEILICDPTDEETKLIGDAFTIIVGAQKTLCGLFKTGGAASLSKQLIDESVEHALKRRQHILQLLGIEDEDH